MRGGHGRRVGALVLGAAAFVAAGCGEQEDRSFCGAFAAYLAVVDPVLAADPTEATAGDALEAVEDVQDALAAARSTAEGRFAAAAQEVDDALDEIRRTLSNADVGDDYATWQPLVEASIDDALDADARLRALVEPACSPAS